jgi:hypothetical protein
MFINLFTRPRASVSIYETENNYDLSLKEFLYSLQSNAKSIIYDHTLCGQWLSYAIVRKDPMQVKDKQSLFTQQKSRISPFTHERCPAVIPLGCGVVVPLLRAPSTTPFVGCCIVPLSS